MAKKSKFLSWFGLGKKDKQEQQEQELEQQRLAEEQAEKLAEEAREKAEQLAEQLAEQERLAAEQAEQERLAAEQAAQEKAEQERLAAEQAAREQAEQERLAAEQAAQEKAEQERLAAEQAAREQAEQERLAAEQAAREQAEQERLAAEQAAQEKAEQERLAAEQAAREQAEQVRLAAEQAAQEKAEQERLAAEQAAQEKAEQERLAAEQAAQEQAEQERLAAEQAAQEQAEQERLAAEQAAQEQERLAAEQAAQEQAEQERLAEEARLAQEREEEVRLAEEAQLAKEQEEQERLAKEQAEKEVAEQEAEEPKKTGFFSRLKKGLLKTKSNIGSGFASLFAGKKIDDELFEELETQLLTADVGVDTTVKLIDNLTDAADRKQLKDGDALYELLKQEMADMLASAEQPLDLDKKDGPFVILMVGVNGVGKTTTIGKLAKQYQQQGKSVMLAAGDTFRAAAVEQLQVWGERNEIPVIAQHTGADSASVVFDAFQAAKARNIDVLIADTAGRLQNKDNLMQELEKIARVMKKIDADAPHEVMLTIDAGTGQNAISQVKLFDQAVGLTGITLTKLDGTAKGGVIFAIADQFKTPIRYIGVGEGIDDLRTFNSNDFIEALFSGEQ
ncbi:signal recognition particle-docking protein FtsY [Pseudoalteromonas sp. T1lg22]|uniref:signal recognition particle-docking protein FtsY n=1 Tax=Pseudoalteromonas sp. T1lg22 TaxID=2077096 RepID=UPI000CF5F4C7|nr:signal recognition particle-docking protein FtsY [Pseudoalteromonas sp. T1lg22]